MRSSELKSSVFQFSKISFWILLSATSLLLLLNGRLGFALFLVFMTLAVLFFLTVLFTQYYLPEVPLTMVMKILAKSITHRVTNYESMIKIVNGKIIGDLNTSLMRKSNRILHIEKNSAAISLGQDSGYKLLLPGIHDLPRTASLCAVLPTYPQRIIFGPESSDSLSKTRGGEGLADYHVRINTARKTATMGADGVVVYTKFECFYRINIDHPNEGILALFKYTMEQDKISSSTLPSDNLQKFIFKLIMNQWEKEYVGKSSGQLINLVPFRLYVDDFAKNGLSGVVFISEIFLED